MIFAHAEGSSGLERLRVTSSMTVTGSPLVMRPMTSPASPARLRTLTRLATTTAGPALRGTVLNSGAAAAFLVVFFLAGAGFFSAAGFTVSAGVVAGVAGGTAWSASTLPAEIIAANSTLNFAQTFIFITQP